MRLGDKVIYNGVVGIVTEVVDDECAWGRFEYANSAYPDFPHTDILLREQDVTVLTDEDYFKLIIKHPELKIKQS